MIKFDLKVVGWGWGGDIALDLVRRFNHNILRLIFVSKLLIVL